MLVLTSVFLSVMVHMVVPDGTCKLALPECTDLSTLAVTRRSVPLTVKVKTHPCFCTLPTPVKVVPLQQNRYWPV